jgi:hypothetical protein
VTTTKQYLDAESRYRKEMEQALDSLIDDTMRRSALPNALAMVGVIAFGFLASLGILIVVTGG